MSEGSGAGRRPDVLRWALAAAVIVGVAAVLYVIVGASFKPAGPADVASFRKGALAKLTIPTDPQPAPANSFQGPDGKPVTLADFKGKVVVVNLWATWCAPCKVEMPTLSRLAATYQGQPVEVMAISIDKEDKGLEARAFIARNKPLTFYWDPAMAMPFAFNPRAEGFPTTIVYDRRGVERARLAGDADWGSPEAIALIAALLAEPA